MHESDFDLSYLQPTVKLCLLKLLFKFSDIFNKGLYTIGHTNAVKPKFTSEFWRVTVFASEQDHFLQIEKTIGRDARCKYFWKNLIVM